MRKGPRAIAEFNKTTAALRNAMGVANEDCMVLEARKTKTGKRTPVFAFLEGIAEKVWLTSPRGEALRHDLDIHASSLREISPAWTDVIVVNAATSLARSKQATSEAKGSAERTGRLIDRLVSVFALTDLLYIHGQAPVAVGRTVDDWQQLVSVYAHETMPETATHEIITQLSSDLIVAQSEYSSKMANIRRNMGVPY